MWGVGGWGGAVLEGRRRRRRVGCSLIPTKEVDCPSRLLTLPEEEEKEGGEEGREDLQ